MAEVVAQTGTLCCKLQPAAAARCDVVKRTYVAEWNPPSKSPLIARRDLRGQSRLCSRASMRHHSMPSRHIAGRLYTGRVNKQLTEQKLLNTFELEMHLAAQKLSNVDAQKHWSILLIEVLKRQFTLYARIIRTSNCIW